MLATLPSKLCVNFSSFFFPSYHDANNDITGGYVSRSRALMKPNHFVFIAVQKLRSLGRSKARRNEVDVMT